MISNKPKKFSLPDKENLKRFFPANAYIYLSEPDTVGLCSLLIVWSPIDERVVSLYLAINSLLANQEGYWVGISRTAKKELQKAFYEKYCSWPDLDEFVLEQLKGEKCQTKI